MARKISDGSDKKQYLTERFLATFFLTLIEKALARLSQGRDTRREMSEAAFDVQKMLRDETNALVGLLTSPINSQSEASIMFKLRYGNVDGYPRSKEATALELGVSLPEVEKAETAWFSEAAKGSEVLIEMKRKQWLEEHPCQYCKTKVGEVHRAGCQGEECPFCHDLLLRCFCAYKHLKIRWGGRTAKEWRRLQNEHGDSFNPRQFARPLTTEEERRWAAIILQKGCILYGSEQWFQ